MFSWKMAVKMERERERERVVVLCGLPVSPFIKLTALVHLSIPLTHLVMAVVIFI